MEYLGTIVAILIVIFILKIFKFTLKTILKVMINGLIGGILLYVLNYIPGVSISITWLNAILVGFFGIPAVLILFILSVIKK